jgi:sec-independent protein translocase protein TatC
LADKKKISKKNTAKPAKKAAAGKNKEFKIAKRSIDIPSDKNMDLSGIVKSKEIYPIPDKYKPANPEKKNEPSTQIQIADESDVEPIDPASLARGDVPMGVVDHLDELRSRIVKILGTLIVFTIVGFIFSDYLLKYVTEPFVKTGLKLNIFTLTGGFFVRMKAAFLAGFLIGLPVLIYQIWSFIAPAIEKKSRKFIRNSLFASIFLFYTGVSFVFFLLLPFAIPVLLGFIGEGMASTIGADDYISFMIIFTLAMGILFELPIVIMILTKMGIVTPKFLSEKRRYAIIIIWIIAAVITPQPDAISQALVAIPLMFLYEVSIIIAKFIYKKKLED